MGILWASSMVIDEQDKQDIFIGLYWSAAYSGVSLCNKSLCNKLWVVWRSVGGVALLW
ncbi:hypothetical protein AB6D20_027720 (plasmid) [Vibrio splendidus]